MRKESVKPDTTYPEHQEYRDWIGGKFDPKKLDLAKINQLLQ